jgi:hypothetical protein
METPGPGAAVALEHQPVNSQSPRVENRIGSPREQAINETQDALTGSLEMIGQAKTDGVFAGDQLPTVDKALALNSDQGITADSSGSLEAVYSTLDEISKIQGPEGQAVVVKDKFSKNLFIRATLNGEDRLFSPSKWKEKLDDQNLPEAERQALKESGLWGFKFPSEEKPEASAERIDVNKTLKDQIKEQQDKIKKGEKAKEDMGKERELLALITLAESAKGETSAYIKERALSELQKSGVAGLDKVLDQIKDEADLAKTKILLRLENDYNIRFDNPEEALKIFESGEFDKLMLNPRFAGLDKFVLGREVNKDDIRNIGKIIGMDEKKIQELIDQKKKGWMQLLLILLVSGLSPLKDNLGKSFSAVPGMVQ